MADDAQKFRVHRCADLPRDAATVKIAVLRKRNVYGSTGEALISYNGKVYAPNDIRYHRASDVRDYPELFTAFSKLSGVSQHELRKARKEWLARASEKRIAERVDSLKISATKLGYKLIKVKK